MDYKIAICDDEKIICSSIEEIVKKYFFSNSMTVDISIFYSGESLAQSIQDKNIFDFIILDIELFELNGVDIGKILRNKLNNFRTQIIYISSKTMYAMELFKVQPLDFLEKPIEYPQLTEVLERGIKLFSKNNSFFSYSVDGDFNRIKYNDIIYFESQGRKICVKTVNGIESFYMNIGNLIKSLPDFFVQVHRSYIININAVISNKYDSVVMIDKNEISIGKKYREYFKNILMRSL